MKLCDLTQFYSPHGGGVKRYLLEKVAYIDRMGTDDHVVIIPGPRTECVRQGRSRIYTIRSPRSGYGARYRIMVNMGRIKDILMEEKPGLIELGDPYHVAWAALRYARQQHIPVIGFYHSNFPEAYVRTCTKFLGSFMARRAEAFAENYVRCLYNRMSRTLVPSPELRELLISWGVTNTVEVSLGVDAKTFCPEAGDRAGLCRKFNIDPNRCILLYVTRLSREKNVQTLLEAFKLLQTSTGGARLDIPPPPQTVAVGSRQNRAVVKDSPRIPSGYHLIIVGDGPLRGLVQETARETGALTWLHYIQDKNELAGLYASADLFVHPGVMETFGLAALESQACGTPVVGIRGSRLDRIIFSGFQYWARQNTPADLAFAIETICRRDLVQLGAEARAGVVEKFSWDSVFNHLFEIYRDTAPL